MFRTLLRHGLLTAVLTTIPLLGQAQETVTLKFTHFLAANSTFQKGVAEPWCAAVEKDSGGKVKCQMYPSMQLGGTPQQLADQVKNGIADIAWTNPGYTTGRFPRMEALELPLTLPPDGLSGSRAMWEYAQQHAMDDFKDFKVLAVFSGTNLLLSTVAKPINGSADLKGLKVRSPSRFTSLFLSALGATPVNMPIAQVTEGLSKGVIDGAMATWEVLPATKMDESTKYHLDGLPQHAALCQPAFVILMNKARYERLSPELKAVIDKHSGTALVETAGRVWDQDNQAARKKIAAMSDHKIATLRAEDYTALQKAADTVQADWVKQAEARGLNGQALATAVRTIGKKHLGN